MPVGSVPHSSQFVVNAIRSAATRTGVDFSYLVATATRESGLRSQATSRTSTAAGAFQFIEQTWLSMIKRHGAEHGYSAYSETIEQGENGRYQIADAELREEILALRHDPRAAALMAGEMTNETTRGLEKALGRGLQENEAYVAHFMGLGGATRLIQAMEANPVAIAADQFQASARANRAIFYNTDGTARTLAQVYDNLTSLPDVSAEITGAAPPAQAASPVYFSPALRTNPLPVFDAPPAASRLPATPSAPGSYSLLLTPGVIELLSSLDPLSALRGNDRDEHDNRPDRFTEV